MFVSVAKLKLRFPDQLAALFVRFGLLDAFVSLSQAISLAFDASVMIQKDGTEFHGPSMAWEVQHKSRSD